MAVLLFSTPQKPLEQPGRLIECANCCGFRRQHQRRLGRQHPQQLPNLLQRLYRRRRYVLYSKEHLERPERGRLSVHDRGFRRQCRVGGISKSGSEHHFFSRSSDGGVTILCANRVVNQPFPSSASRRRFAGNINVAWIEGWDGPVQAIFSRSSDGGATFTAPKVISWPSDAGLGLQMALDSKGNISAVWVTQPYGNLYLSHSRDGGATFSRTSIYK